LLTGILRAIALRPATRDHQYVIFSQFHPGFRRNVFQHFEILDTAFRVERFQPLFKLGIALAGFRPGATTYVGLQAHVM
jgi:hypothetical protein